MTIDLCVVAGRRPDLLQPTITSFNKNILRFFPIRNVFVNIDPVLGTQEDHDRCREIVRSHFPDAVFFEPTTPSFGSAVKRLWAATSAEYVFHLEDDWIALREVGEELLKPFSDPAVAQTSFNTKEKRWNVAQKGPLHQRRSYRRLFGIKIPLAKNVPIFTTSPSLLRGEFARRCAELMIGSLDPEKQFYTGTNEALSSYTSCFRNYLFPPSGELLIKDIGRHWRYIRGIEKKTVNGESIWINLQDQL